MTQSTELSGADLLRGRVSVAKSKARSLFSFPNPVDDYAARVVAGIVVALCAATIVLGQGWLLIPLAYGFWARVLTGPRLSPAGLFATRIAAPRLAGRFGPARLVPGPPKRFAQGIGVAFSTTALMLWFVGGLHTEALVATGLLATAAFLESAFALCLGCTAFSLLMKIGLVPEEVCAECADITKRVTERAEAAA